MGGIGEVKKWIIIIWIWVWICRYPPSGTLMSNPNKIKKNQQMNKNK
jgi:hypothetical protein